MNRVQLMNDIETVKHLTYTKADAIEQNHTPVWKLFDIACRYEIITGPKQVLEIGEETAGIVAARFEKEGPRGVESLLHDVYHLRIGDLVYNDSSFIPFTGTHFRNEKEYVLESLLEILSEYEDC